MIEPLAASHLPAIQWSLVLALAALVGYACQRQLGLPRCWAMPQWAALPDFFGLGAALWRLQGRCCCCLELGIAVVLFECGARINVRWFVHNPMVLVQSVLEAA